MRVAGAEQGEQEYGFPRQCAHWLGMTSLLPVLSL